MHNNNQHLNVLTMFFIYYYLRINTSKALKLLTHLIFKSTLFSRYMYYPFLQIRKLRYKRIKFLVQGHRAVKRQSQDSNSAIQAVYAVRLPLQDMCFSVYVLTYLFYVIPVNIILLILSKDELQFYLQNVSTLIPLVVIKNKNKIIEFYRCFKNSLFLIG